MTLRVTGLLHFGMQVPDLSQGEKFYGDFGLETGEDDGRLVVRCDGRDQDQALISEGPKKAIGHVAFGIENGSTDEWTRHLEGLGLKLLDAPAGGREGGLWFRDPDGNHINLREEPLAQWRSFGEQTYNWGDVAPRVDQAAWQTLINSRTRPRRMGHLLLFSSDNEKSEQFYTRTIGMRLSDKIPGGATFMHSAPGDHHIFGFIQSTHPGLHHTSWEVANIDEIAIGAQTMSQRGYSEAWGLGRHSLGSNLFTYIRDPWGSWIEYFSDIDKIGENWEPSGTDVPPAVWCAMMPPETFHINFEEAPRS